MIGNLFHMSVPPAALPSDYRPVRPLNFEVNRIVLSKGSISTAERKGFVERICALYPKALVTDRTGTSHNRIDLDQSTPIALHREGKRTLVFGQLASAVRFSEEEGNTCPNYWHFSPYGFCFYGCKYCYLAGTRGVWFSPTVKVYVNLPEILHAIERQADAIGRPTAFYLGKLQDGLGLDPLTAYSTVLVPSFARHAYARQVILTKSASVERLLDLDHGGHTILSWSLNPPEVVRRFEENTPSVEDRIEAMYRCAQRGYALRAVLMPVIPIEGWEAVYGKFVRELLERVPIRRLTMGGICIYQNALTLMERKIGRDNAISRNLDPTGRLGDGRRRYPASLRVRMYGEIVRAAREIVPEIELALCLEEAEVWQALSIKDRMGRCNCVL